MTYKYKSFPPTDTPLMQVELLKAASQRKEVPFKVAYGLTLTGMRQWGLYISEPRCA